MRDQQPSNREAELPAIPRIGSGDWLGCIACKQCGGVIGKPKIRVGIYFSNDQPQFRLGTSQVICDNCGCAGPRCESLDCAVKLWNELMQPNEKS